MSIFRKIKEWLKKKKQTHLETALQECGIDSRRFGGAKPLDTEYPFGGVYESTEDFEAHVAELREKSQLNDFPFFCPVRGTIVVITEDDKRRYDKNRDRVKSDDGECDDKLRVYTVWVWDGEKLVEIGDMERNELEDKLC